MKNRTVLQKSMLVMIVILSTAFMGIYLIACQPIATTDKNESVTDSVMNETKYVWEKYTDSAAFAKSYNFPMFVIRDTLWIMHPTGAWYSVNGSEWTQSVLGNIIKNSAFLKYVWFNNALYALGTFEGNIEKYKFTTAIHKTTDMRNWEKLADNSNLPERFFYKPFVFDNKIWIIGGTRDEENFSDIWNSSDGVKWEKVAEDLPFGKRNWSQVIHFNDKLYLLNNDVWMSKDAIHWEKVTDEIIPGNQVFGYATVVYDNQVWLLGCNRNNIFKSEVIKSHDCITWTPVAAPWSPRGGIAAAVYQDKIFMTGGKYGGLPDAPEFIYSNDVWAMRRKK